MVTRSLVEDPRSLQTRELQAVRTGPRPRSVTERMLRPLLGVRGLLILIVPLALWQIFGSAQSFSFPYPSTWLPAVWDLNARGLLLPAAERTLTTFILSLIIALVIGVTAGMILGSVKLLDKAFSPFLDFFRAVPPPALVPALGLLLGPTLISSVTIVVLAIIWPILLNTVNGVRMIPEVRKDMARSLGLSWSARITKVLLPSLTPNIMTGLRVSVSLSLIVTLVTDILGTGQGLGRLLIDQQQFFEAQAVWGLLVLIGAFGYLINMLFRMLERKLMSRWPAESRF